MCRIFLLKHGVCSGTYAQRDWHLPGGSYTCIVRAYSCWSIKETKAQHTSFRILRVAARAASAFGKP